MCNGRTVIQTVIQAAWTARYANDDYLSQDDLAIAAELTTAITSMASDTATAQAIGKDVDRGGISKHRHFTCAASMLHERTAWRLLEESVVRNCTGIEAVSYTHLTLPTICSV